jgi:hypothetical protein
VQIVDVHAVRRVMAECGQESSPLQSRAPPAACAIPVGAPR